MMLRNLLLAAAILAAFAAGYCFRPSPSGRGSVAPAPAHVAAPVHANFDPAGDRAVAVHVRTEPKLAQAPVGDIPFPPLDLPVAVPPPGLLLPPPDPVPSPPKGDVAADVIRSHFNTLAGLTDAGKKEPSAKLPEQTGYVVALPKLDSANLTDKPIAKRPVLEPAAAPPIRPPSSVSGVLRRASVRINNRQAYGVEDDAGKLLYFVTTAEDRLDLDSYVDRRVDLAGLTALPTVVSGVPCVRVAQVLSPPALPAQVFRSRSTLVSFPFQVTQAGPSGVREAQLWMTPDDGKSWQLLARQAGGRSPIQARLPGEGRYGFRLVLVGGDGAATEPPQPGNAPDMTIALETRDHVVPQGRLLPITMAVEDAPMPREVNQPQPVGRPAPASFESVSEWLPMPRTIEPLPMPRQLNPPERHSPSSNVGHLPTHRPMTALWPHPAEHFMVAMGGMHVRSWSAATFSGMMIEERGREDASSLSAYLNLPNGAPAAHLRIPGLPALLEAVGP